MAAFRIATVFVGLVLSCAGLQADEEERSSLPEKIVSAWRKSGAIHDSDWSIVQDGPAALRREAATACDFFIADAKRSDAKSMPDPGRPFALEVQRPREGFLAEGLPRWPSLRQLTIRDARFDEGDWRAIAACPQMTTLRLQSEMDRFAAQGLGRLAAAKKLRNLIVQTGHGASEVLAEIAKVRQIETLHLAGSDICDRDLAALAGMNLRKLTAPDSVWTEVGVENIIAALSPDVREFSIPQNLLTSKGLKRVCGMRSLESLSLCRVALDRSLAMNLAQMPKLSHLSLLGSAIADDALPELAKTPALKSLDLSSSAVAHADLRAFAGKKLQNLSLPETAMRRETFGDWIAALDPSRDELDASTLQPWKLDDDMLAQIAKLRELRSIHFPAFKVTDQGIRHLRGLKLKRISAPAQAMTDFGLQYLIAAIDPEIEEVHLSGTFGDDSVRRLMNSKNIEVLLLDSPNITDETARMAALLPRLNTLHLASGRFSDRSLKFLSNSKTLRHLNIDRGISGAGIRRMAGRNLRSFTLPDNLLSSECLSDYLATLDRDLASLELNYWRISDDDLAALAPFEKATHIGLQGTAVHGVGLRHLRTRKLQSFNLPNDARNDVGIRPLAALLDPKTSQLMTTDWRLTDAEIGELKRLNELRVLDLRSSFVSEAGLESIAGMRLICLGVPLGIRSDRGLVATLALLDPHIPWLNFSGWTLGKNAAAAIAKRPNLRKLDLQGAEIEPGALKLLAQCPQLIELNISGATLPEKEFGALADLPELETLHIGASISSASLESLRRANRLKHLHVVGADQPLSHLKALRGLRLESLSWQSLADDEHVLHWAAAVDPRRCPIPELGQGVTAKSLSILAKLPGQEILNLAETAINDFDLPLLAGSKQKRIDLPPQAKTPLGLKHLLAALDPEATSLSLQGMSGLNASIMQVRGLNGLQSLDLSDTDLTPEGLAKLNGMRLKQLFVPEPCCDDEGVRHAMAAMHPDYFGEFLAAHCLRLSRRGLMSLPQGIPLRSLHLAQANLIDADLDVLRGRNLDTLVVNRNILTDCGVKHYLAAHHPCILNFDLCQTAITDAGLEAVAERGNIAQLYLRGTLVTDACIPHLLRLRSLRHVDLRGTRVSEVGVARLRAELPECGISTGDNE